MTITPEQADLVADALFDQVPMQQVWRVAHCISGGSHAELDLFIAVTMFGNAALRIREAMGELEPWEVCEFGPCSRCCAYCEAATGGVCYAHRTREDCDPVQR